MSILIRGMEMPKKGEYSMTLYVCSDGSAYMDVASFPVDKDKFEAIPVSPHGDLIDLDAYRDEFMNGVYALCRDDSDNYRANAIIDLFDAAPTIIPAKEGE